MVAVSVWIACHPRVRTSTMTAIPGPTRDVKKASAAKIPRSQISYPYDVGIALSRTPRQTPPGLDHRSERAAVPTKEKG